MGGSKGAKEELGAEEVEVVLDGKELGLRMKMAGGGHLQRPSSDAEGGILDPLELEDSRGGGIGVPDGSGVGDDGSDEGFVGGEEGFPLLAPVGASKGFEDIESIAGFGGYEVDMGGESEMGVESDTQDARGPI